MIAIALIFAMVGAVAMTSTVSATPADTPKVIQRDLVFYYDHAKVWGTITIDTTTGHVVANVNYQKLPEVTSGSQTWNKQTAKDSARDGAWDISDYMWIQAQTDSGAFYYLIADYSSMPVNNGGTAHFDGYLKDLPDFLAWWDSYGNDAYFVAW